jgi:cyclophilin family peptidyl-prolyl cis-trans isomerase
MTRHRHKRKANRRKGARIAPPPAPPGPADSHHVRRWALIGGGLALGLALWFWFGSGPRADNASTKPPPTSEETSDPAPKTGHANGHSNASAGHQSAKAGRKEPGGSFLEAFGTKEGSDGDSAGKTHRNEELEKTFQALLDVKDRLRALADRAKAWQGNVNPREFQEALAERDQLTERLNKETAAFQKDLAQARSDRPKDPVPEWLTGELLILVGGEPEAILPYLRRAVEGKLVRPRLFASLAQTQTEANHLEDGFSLARKALDLDEQDRYVWATFTRTAFNTEHFAAVLERLDRAFEGKQAPAWATEMRSDAATRLAAWQAEQKLRQAAAKADDLPRVRLTIEHRRFGRDARGASRIEVTGHGEVIVELFEDQAPATVANFLDLVEKKAYNGTRFYQAVPGALTAGGDTASKGDDPAKDGSGSPGYFIPDEFDRPGARRHFRGALSMVNHGPHTAASQFFITFAPMREMDGKFTVFGRVLKGQDVVDRITLGRTNQQVGQVGRLIPGDLLLHAEVLRKRNHEYRVIREPVK